MTAEAPANLFGIVDTLGEGDYRRLAEFIHARSGIKMPASKRTLLEGRLRKRLGQLGYQSFSQYCRYVFEAGGLAEEERQLIDAVTTNKTDFFREPHHFEFLNREGLPRLTERGHGIHQPLRIWSAGCSIGAEPYTLAMVCQDFAQRTPRFQFQIEASDICVSALQQAGRAIYPHSVIEPVPMEMRKRYLLRDDEHDEVRIAPELRRRVAFFHINLVAPDYPVTQPVDILFCRNLLIYFDKPTQRKVLERLCRHLRVGGYLFLGHSESISGLGLPLSPVGTTVFQREGLK